MARIGALERTCPERWTNVPERWTNLPERGTNLPERWTNGGLARAPGPI
jgi:hypothetical protein